MYRFKEDPKIWLKKAIIAAARCHLNSNVEKSLVSDIVEVTVEVRMDKMEIFAILTYKVHVYPWSWTY